MTDDRDEVMAVTAKLVRSMNPVISDAEVQAIASVAADAYLEHLDEVAPGDRRELLEAIIDEVMESY